MSVAKARECFLGKTSAGRLNCAQSVVCAFKGKFALPDAMVAEFAAYGGGKAPGGKCGAFYAARLILEKRAPDKLRGFEEAFVAQAGAMTCKEIRALRKLSCLGCIEKAAEWLESL